MKVAIANKFFFRNGGSEVVMFQERNFLIGHGVEVVDFAMADPRNEPSAYERYFAEPKSYRAGGPIERASAALSFVHSAEAVRKFSALLDETKPDIAHFHNIYHQLTPSIIRAAARRGISTVLTLHDYKVMCPTYTRLRHGKPCSLCAQGQVYHLLRHRCADGSLSQSALLVAEATIQSLLGSYGQVDLFIAPSEFMRQALLERFPNANVALLRNGIDVPDDPGASVDDGYVLYLGRLSAEKGVETLLKSHVRAKGAWRLVVAGTGPLETSLRNQYPDAEFVGYQSGGSLDTLLRHAAIVVVPSEWYENAPLSALEAMAAGKPVVVSRIGGLPELVTDGETGLLFEPGDATGLGSAIERLMREPQLRSAMGRAGRERARTELSALKHGETLLRHYSNFISTIGSRSNAICFGKGSPPWI